MIRNLALESWIRALQLQRESRNLPMQPGASSHEISLLSLKVKEHFGFQLPERHLDLLRMTNGVNENSLVIYATHFSRDLISDVLGRESSLPDFIIENKAIHNNTEEFENMLFFSSSSIYYYGINLETGMFVVQPHDLDPPSAYFDDYDSLMAYAISQSLLPEFHPVS